MDSEAARIARSSCAVTSTADQVTLPPERAEPEHELLRFLLALKDADPATLPDLRVEPEHSLLYFLGAAPTDENTVAFVTFYDTLGVVRVSGRLTVRVSPEIRARLERALDHARTAAARP